MVLPVCPEYRPRGFWWPERTIRELQVLVVENCSVVGSEMMNAERTWADTDSVCYTPISSPRPRLLRLSRMLPTSTTQEIFEEHLTEPGVLVLEGVWQASTQGLKAAAKDDGRRKGEGTVRLDSGSQSLTREGRVE